jgi:hypothetical protein
MTGRHVAQQRQEKLSLVRALGRWDLLALVINGTSLISALQ